MYPAVKGVYKDGKITFVEKLEGIEEADVLVIVLKEKKKKKSLTNEIVKALEEVKLMREGRIIEKDWEELRNEI
jgi:predicted metal-dependent TIM-barrel fold hydrolase